MKATELMIGDWMQFANGNKKCMVVGIKCDARFLINEATITVMDSSGLWFEKTIDELKPIPLTSEILEKNGWVYNDEDEKFFPQTWVGGGLMLQGADDCGYCIVVASDYDDEDTNRTPFILLYVHELQHALRLRRIEKEITL